MRHRRRWLIGVGVLLAAAVGPLSWQLLQMTWERHVQHRRLQRLEAFKQQLTDEHVRLTTDPVYVEGLIRSTFKVAKPNELVIPSDSLSDSSRR